MGSNNKSSMYDVRKFLRCKTNHSISGSSKSPCSDTYRGSAAFSEPETNQVSAFILTKAAGFWKGYIDFHSYGQLWMSPWGYTSATPPDSAMQLSQCTAC